MRQCIGLFPFLALLATGLPAQAANWEVEPTFRLAETWTDNYRRSEDDPDSERITEIAPGVRLSGEGRRADLDLVYRMQHLAHVEESDRNRTDHFVNADGGVELFRERLFFTADATRAFDTGRGDLLVSDSNAITSDQSNVVTTWSAGPRFQYRLGSFAGMQAEYRRQYVDFGSRTYGESDSDITTLGLTSGPMFTTWGWALDYSRRDESRTSERAVDDDASSGDLKLERLRGELNLRAGPATQLFVAGGTERNEFQTAEASDPIDGDFWEAGFRWRPNRTVALEAATGERFFGDTSRGSLTINGSALSLELGYSESVVTAPQLQFERQSVLLTDDEGNPVVVDGQPVTAVIDIPFVRDDVFIEERSTARLRWDHSHTTVTLSYIAADREFQREGTTERSRQTDLEAAWTRLPLTTVEAGIGTRERELVEQGRETGFTTARLGAIRELAPNADLEVELEHISQWGGFDARQATIALEMTF